MWRDVMERQWTHFLDAIRTDDATCGWNELTTEETELFDDGIAALTTATAYALTEVYDFSRHTSVLDLGGGAGTFLAAIIKKYPQLRATLFERPQMVEKVSIPGVTFIAGDLRLDRIPGNHDAVLIANVLHLFKPSDNEDLLRRIRLASATGTRLLLVDFWMERDDRKPEFGALLAGEFLIVSGGDVYRLDEGTKWLERTGWRYVSHRRLTRASSLLVAEAAELSL
jgi:cyclopropane fatty-acyl-phospholipid synthase-like methyltransferase